jgi:hypothetical protein
VGDNINYVYDDSQAAIALFGTPTIVGDSVVFVPSAFRAESLNGEVAEPVLADFVFSSVYNTGLGGLLGPVQVFESGDYSIGGGRVVADVGVRIEDNNSSFMLEGQAEFSDAGTTDNAALWEIAASFNAGPLTDIQVTLRNVLTASSVGVGDYGWIQKKLLFVTAAPDILVSPPGAPGFPVPAPGVLMLMGLGLVALGWNRRPKSKRFF